MFTAISGIFVKIAFADQVDILLGRGSSDRPAARYNRHGQDALYLSASEAGARVAMQKYAKIQTLPRVLIRYEIEPCQLLDLRLPEAKETRKLVSGDWLQAIANGEEPASWRITDELRTSGRIGLIDQSRKNPNLWHITLLRWNEVGAPGVTMVGKPTPICL